MHDSDTFLADGRWVGFISFLSANGSTACRDTALEASAWRQFAIGSVLTGAVLAVPRLGPTALARQADLTSAGYPTIDVTVTASAYEGVPETLEAGRYLLNVTVAEDAGEFGGVAFLQPYEMSAEEFFAYLGGGEAPPVASPEAAATEAEEGGGEEGPLPPFVYQSTFAGGAAAEAGGTASAVVDLTEGEWIAWGDEPDAAQMPVVFTVTGEFPAEVEEPESDVTITLVDFGIMVEGNLVAGEHVVMIDNQGAQPHFVDLSMVPDGTTNDDLTALLASFMTEMASTPAPGGLSEEDFQSVAYTPTQSIDVQVWTTLTLEAGTYAALCWFPTAGIVDPHAFHGMHTVFEVTA